MAKHREELRSVPVTFDAVALCRDRPGPETLLAAMREAGGELRVDTAANGQLIQLYAGDGRLMLTTESARLIQVPGEARRLLGADVDAPHPVWWVETRAPGHDPQARETAVRFTTALVGITGGVSWSTR